MMRRSISRLMMAAMLVLLPLQTLAADKYLFELLDDSHYLASWNALIASRPDAPRWLAQYGKKRNGPATPTETVRVGERAYRVNMVCKAHDCGDNRFYVIFSDDGHKAWGRLLIGDKRETLFGRPDRDTIAALRAAS